MSKANRVQKTCDSLLASLNKRLISDFENETRDFAMLFLIASANGLEDWPPQNNTEDGDHHPGLLTFH
jgi:hypothetical protein